MREDDGAVLVREARSGEYVAVGRLTQAAWEEFARRGDPVWEAYFELLGDVERRATRAVVLVAQLDGQLVGTASVELDATIEPEGELGLGQANFRMLAVDPEWRNRGVGRMLVAACLARARNAGKRVATLHTVEEMVVARRMYECFGFERNDAADVAISPDTTLLGYRLVL